MLEELWGDWAVTDALFTSVFQFMRVVQHATCPDMNQKWLSDICLPLLCPVALVIHYSKPHPV